MKTHPILLNYSKAKKELLHWSTETSNGKNYHSFGSLFYIKGDLLKYFRVVNLINQQHLKIMITKNLRVNQLSAKAYENYLTYLHAIDKKDVEGYGKFLAQNVTVQFNNDEPIHGKQNVLQGLGYYWQSFGSVEHDLTNIFGIQNSYVLEALNHYIRKDGKKATIKAVAFTDLDEIGLVKSVRIYQDVSPVFS